MMRVEQWPVTKPKPYPNNPRKIGKLAIEKVATSIREFGFQQPIVVDKSGVVIVGHARLAAAKSIGLDTIPVVVADLSKAKAKAYRLADNRTNQETAFDDDLLKITFEELTGLDIDLSITGFDADEINKILGNGAASGDPSPQLSGLSYSVVVRCKDEAHQGELLAKFEKEGLTCEALIS